MVNIIVATSIFHMQSMIAPSISVTPLLNKAVAKAIHLSPQMEALKRKGQEFIKDTGIDL